MQWRSIFLKVNVKCPKKTSAFQPSIPYHVNHLWSPDHFHDPWLDQTCCLFVKNYFMSLTKQFIGSLLSVFCFVCLFSLLLFHNFAISLLEYSCSTMAALRNVPTDNDCSAVVWFAQLSRPGCSRQTTRLRSFRAGFCSSASSTAKLNLNMTRLYYTSWS